MSHLLLEKKADDFRNHLSLNITEALPLPALLYRLNVLTVFRPLSSDFSGMAIKVGDGDSAKLFMLVNSSHAIGKQNFTICHELYHLYIQKDFTARVCKTGLFEKNSGEELSADIFASYFLLPTSGIKSLIPDEQLRKNKIDISTILKIEQYFCCSRSALLYRLKQMGIIDGTGYNNLLPNVKRSAVENGYSTRLYEPSNQHEVIGDYGVKAKALFESGTISESHYFSLLLDLGMNAEQIESIHNGEE